MPQHAPPRNFSKPELESHMHWQGLPAKGERDLAAHLGTDPCRGPSLGLSTFPFACPCRNAESQSASQITPSQHVGGLDVLFAPVDWSASKCVIPPSVIATDTCHRSADFTRPSLSYSRLRRLGDALNSWNPYI